MPGYRLRKAPKRDLYWVVGQDGTKHSKEPLPKERAEAQRRALYAAWRTKEMQGGQITDEQIEKYAPTISAALGAEFQPGPEPDMGAYNRYKKGVEKARARGMTTPLMTYDEWASMQRTRNEGRQFAVDATKKKVISELPDLIKGFEDLEADPLVMCPYDAKGTVQKTSMRKSECKAARDQWEKINHPENYYFFRPAVEGLVKVGDFAAENIAPLLPGIGKLAGEAYKQFAPPESQFYEGSLGQMISGRGNMHYVARRVGGRRVKDIRKLAGKGWFKDAWMSAKRFATGAYERAAAVFKGPRQDFSPSVRNTLAQVGNLPVVEMSVRRDPIQSLLNKALNVISLGRWDKLRKEYNYDELFHLGVEVTVRLSESNNYTRRYVIEKNEVINVSPAKAYTDKTQTWRIPMSDSTTIDTLLANTKLIMGANFFPYDPFKNNCQDFIWSLLTANGYATPELKAIVKQPMEDLVSKLPGFTGKIAKAVTDVGALANVALEGQGKEKPTPMERFVTTRNAVKAELDAAIKTYNLAKSVGDEATAAYMADAVRTMKKDIKKGDEVAQFRVLPAMAPGAAADWSMPPKKGSGLRRGGMQRQAASVPEAARRLRVERESDPEYQRAVERRRNRISALSALASLIPSAAASYFGTEGSIPATITISAIATLASTIGSLAVDERRRRRQEERQSEMAVRDYLNTLETTPQETEEDRVAYVDPANPMTIYTVEPGQPAAEAPAPAAPAPREHVSIAVEPGTFTVENPMRRGRGKCVCPPGKKTPFQLQLKSAGVCPQKYLEAARRAAKRSGYSPADVEFSDKLDKKLMMHNQAGRKVHFGAVGSGDFLLHSLEGNKKLAAEKRDLYLARAQKIKGNWREDRYSPNSLAIQILWAKPL
jgi:hypothetical protein